MLFPLFFRFFHPLLIPVGCSVLWLVPAACVLTTNSSPSLLYLSSLLLQKREWKVLLHCLLLSLALPFRSLLSSLLFFSLSYPWPLLPLCTLMQRSLSRLDWDNTRDSRRVNDSCGERARDRQRRFTNKDGERPRVLLLLLQLLFQLLSNFTLTPKELLSFPDVCSSVSFLARHLLSVLSLSLSSSLLRIKTRVSSIWFVWVNIFCGWTERLPPSLFSLCLKDLEIYHLHVFVRPESDTLQVPSDEKYPLSLAIHAVLFLQIVLQIVLKSYDSRFCHKHPQVTVIKGRMFCKLDVSLVQGRCMNKHDTNNHTSSLLRLLHRRLTTKGNHRHHECKRSSSSKTEIRARGKQEMSVDQGRDEQDSETNDSTTKQNRKSRKWLITCNKDVWSSIRKVSEASRDNFSSKTPTWPSSSWRNSCHKQHQELSGHLVMFSTRDSTSQRSRETEAGCSLQLVFDIREKRELTSEGETYVTTLIVLTEGSWCVSSCAMNVL